jgi:hypothetical protein
MTWEPRARQTLAIAQIELRRVFFSKRSFWVYLLALFPMVIFVGHGVQEKLRAERWSHHNVTPAAILDSIAVGDTEDEVEKRAGDPIEQNKWRWRDEHKNWNEGRHLGYYDGHRKVNLMFENGKLKQKHTESLLNFDEDQQVFSGVFQFFYLRVAVFFGCLGIFMNLFRGEMLDKTLHYWFLAPARREVLLAGKYLAGLIAAVVIFSLGAMLSFGAMLWPHDPAQVQAYWQSGGASHLFWYAAAAALGCVGYGSVFLAAGLLVRNPIVPAIVLLVWESINGFLPSILQKFSVLHYVQALCPVPPPLDPGMPALLRLLLSPAEPPSRIFAVLGLLVLTALVLWAAARAVRQIEINYGTE